VWGYLCLTISLHPHDWHVKTISLTRLSANTVSDLQTGHWNSLLFGNMFLVIIPDDVGHFVQVIQINMNKTITKTQPCEMLDQVPKQPITLPGCLARNIDGEPCQVWTGNFSAYRLIMFLTTISRIDKYRLAILTTDRLNRLKDIILHLHVTTTWATHLLATKVIR